MQKRKKAEELPSEFGGVSKSYFPTFFFSFFIGLFSMALTGVSPRSNSSVELSFHKTIWYSSNSKIDLYVIMKTY